jgi:ABC-type uncharacterized transport system involved in gliding motility auxiliary subunit
MNGLLFFVVVAALGVLFAAALRVPVGRLGWPRWLGRGLIVAGALGSTVAANIALYRNDSHLDLTASKAFTPAPEVEQLVRDLRTDVDLVYFYQKADPAARNAKMLVELLARASPRLHVRTIDADQYPGVASRYEVRAYNVAVLDSGGRRVQVNSTSDRDIGLGLLRVTRAEAKTVCFAVGHGEYDIDNMEYHTHFEGGGGHSHSGEGAVVVLMEQHGFGRVRRALEGLGLATRKVPLATTGRVPADCTVLVDGGPRTRYTPTEVEALSAYLSGGGSALLLFDLNFPVEPALAGLLARIGIRVGEGVVVDPAEHYFTDEQMVAVTSYPSHPITLGLALSFFPGVRPLELVPASPGVSAVPLLASSGESYVRPLRAGPKDDASRGHLGQHLLAVASSGTLAGAASAQTFRAVVMGDADFATNSFFPYMSNADLLLSTLAWLAREERASTLKPAVEVLPRVSLTGRQVQGIFVSMVLVLPGLAALAGGVLWWRRRR